MKTVHWLLEARLKLGQLSLCQFFQILTLTFGLLAQFSHQGPGFNYNNEHIKYQSLRDIHVKNQHGIEQCLGSDTSCGCARKALT